MSQQPSNGGSLSTRVRMESPDALFSPDHHIETPVPAPLYLLTCLRLPLETAYAMREDGTVENPAHAFQRHEIVFPDGSRFLTEVSGNPSLGLPSIYDLDYLLGAIRIADQGGADADGRLPGVTYSDLIRATRSERTQITLTRLDGAKRALGRWGNTTVRTAMEQVFADEERDEARAGKPQVPGMRPRRREREASHWILEYDLETERWGKSSRDLIATLRLNPAWRTQTDLGLVAWVDVEIHNSLRSGLAKAMYLQLVLAAAQGSLLSLRIATMDEWKQLLGVQSTDRANKIAGRFQEAISALRELGVLRSGEVHSPQRGRYEILIEPAEPIAKLVAARGIGSLDPIRTRTLVWHLGRIGFSAAEARKLLAQYGIKVQEVLRRVHYERTVRRGLDAKGEPVLRWELWVAKALKHGWRFEETEYVRWLESQDARFTRSIAESGARVPQRRLAEPPAGKADPFPALPASTVSLPDDVWGQARQRLRNEIGDAAFRSWLLDTWLTELLPGRVVVGTSNDFAARWIEQKYRSRLESILAELLGEDVSLRLEIETAGPPSVE